MQQELTRNAMWLIVLFVASFGASAPSAVGQTSPEGVGATSPLKILLVDGQNNHGNWPTTSEMMAQYLEATGLFTVSTARTKPEGTDPDFHPDFSEYAAVVTNYNGARWPQETEKAFEAFVRGGGGLVVVHAADNAFGDWPEYNQMIGLGGWGNRDEKSGPLVFYNADGKVVRDASAGRGGNHGPQHPFAIVIRNPEHPITQGMPRTWMHANDELYDSLRGPAENMEILATAFSSPDKSGTGRHEPMLIVLEYGRGRVFHTPMGHGNDSQECVGFIVALQRGTEWAATGKVTQAIPDDFPDAGTPRSRKFAEAKTTDD